MIPFIPEATVNLVAGVATSNVSLGAGGQIGKTVRLVNAGTVIAFIKFGGVAVTAALTDLPLLPGTVEFFFVNESSAAIYLAAITASGTPTIYATIGGGS